MLDGRVDMQGTVKELRARGLLGSFELGKSVSPQGRKEEGPVQVKKDELERQRQGRSGGKSTPRKLVKEEHREEGRVKRVMYKTYIKAS
jgi:hypothetical protein